MHNFFDTKNALSRVNNILDTHGISHDDGSDVCGCEAAMVIESLQTTLNETLALLKQVTSKGIRNMPMEEQAFWQGSAEAVIEHSVSVLEPKNKIVLENIEHVGDNIVRLINWTSSRNKAVSANCHSLQLDVM
jgi:hypothetical protein